MVTATILIYTSSREVRRVKKSVYLLGWVHVYGLEEFTAHTGKTDSNLLLLGRCLSSQMKI